MWSGKKMAIKCFWLIYKNCCCPGSNWGPLVCKTNVITTTPQQLHDYLFFNFIKLVLNINFQAQTLVLPFLNSVTVQFPLLWAQNYIIQGAPLRLTNLTKTLNVSMYQYTPVLQIHTGSIWPYLVTYM